MTRVFVYITQISGLNILLILVIRKLKFCFSISKWDTLSVLNIENEKHFVSKNHGTVPLSEKLLLQKKLIKKVHFVIIPEP
jgi:hypothetical protein